MTRSFSDALEPAEVLVQGFLEVLPTVILVVIILIAGGLLSLALARFAAWFVRHSGLETLAERAGLPKLLYRIGVRRGVSTIASRLGLVTGLLLTVFLGADVAGLRGFAEALSQIIGFLPQVLIALLVLVGGTWAASVVRRLLSRPDGDESALESPELVSELAYYCVIVVSLTVSADQLGIQTRLINMLIAISFAAVAAGLALAFALGARETLGNIIARHYALRLFRPGDQVEVDETTRGIVERHLTTTLVLRGERGEMIIPYADLFRHPVRVSRTVVTTDEED